jgi:hypothetical protein
MADESVIRKLEGILQEKIKQIDSTKKAREQNDNAISEMRQLLEDERRKSLADEGRIN